METYFDEVGGNILKNQMKHADFWPGINEVIKYVVSRIRKKSDWKNSVFYINLADIEKLKNQPVGMQGLKVSDIQVHGSVELIQLLQKNDLVDEIWLNFLNIHLKVSDTNRQRNTCKTLTTKSLCCLHAI